MYAASQSVNDITNQYGEYLKPVSRGFTLASVKKVVQEEGYLVQANPFHAGGCDCHAVFCIRFRKKHINLLIIIWHVVVSNICKLIHLPCVRSCSLLKPTTNPFSEGA